MTLQELREELAERLAARRSARYGYTSDRQAGYADGREAELQDVLDRLDEVLRRPEESEKSDPNAEYLQFQGLNTSTR